MLANTFADNTSGPPWAFGRFDLHELLGRSAATLVWLATDRRGGAEVMLTMPREAPADAAALARWLERARHAARLDHPNLARVVDVGVHDQMPFIVVARANRVTLREWREAYPGTSAVDASGWLCAALQGLAFAHEGGAWHGDLQLHHLLIDERGKVVVMGLGADAIALPRNPGGAIGRGIAHVADRLRDQRVAAERDVLACGVLLHHLLGGAPPFGLDDTARVIARMAPLGREVLRLPWTMPLPIFEALRAIADRATASSERLRYRSARTLIGALAGWLAVQANDNGGPIALLLDRLHSVGHLPALPGLTARLARVAALEDQRTDQIAEQILPDMALSFELLRTLNTARVQGTQVAGNGTVLALRRIVALIGVDGVRKAAYALRAWPGPLGAEAAGQLKSAMERVRFAGRVAQALRPPGYDAEVVYLIAVMQSLGRLLVRYHFADEARQIDQLMRPLDAARGGDGETAHGGDIASASADARDRDGAAESDGARAALSEDAASYAVLGVDIASFGYAAARQWGVGDEVLHMIRRMPADAPVHKADDDAGLLRALASAANEAVDAVSALSSRPLGVALKRIAERYERVLGCSLRSLQDALQSGRDAERQAALPRRSRATAETGNAVGTAVAGHDAIQNRRSA